MDTSDKLEALHSRLIDEQRCLLTASAGSQMLPSSGAMRKLAHLELTIAAVGEMIAEGEPPGAEN